MACIIAKSSAKAAVAAAKPYNRPVMGPPSILMGPPSIKKEYKAKKELMASIHRAGYTLFTEKGWKGSELLIGRTLVMDKTDCVWECVGNDMGCLAFVGLWGGNEMIPLELCDDE
jgi:hypothetical protein